MLEVKIYTMYIIPHHPEPSPFLPKSILGLFEVDPPPFVGDMDFFRGILPVFGRWAPLLGSEGLFRDFSAPAYTRLL